MRLQTADAGSASIARGSAADSASSSAIQCARRIMAADGPRGLFRGLSAPLVANLPINALLFGVEHAADDFLSKSSLFQGVSEMVRQFAAGAISGASQVLIACPSDHIKIKLQIAQAQGSGYTGPVHCARDIVQNYGVRGLFRGLLATAIRDVPGFGIYFTTYAAMKSGMTAYIRRGSGVAVPSSTVAGAGETATPAVEPTVDYDAMGHDYIPSDFDAGFSAFSAACEGSERAQPAAAVAAPASPVLAPELTAAHYMFAGGIAGVASWAFLYPLDVMKTLVQSVPMHKEARIIPTVRQAVQRRGSQLLWSGLTPTMARAFPVSAVTFLVFEWVLQLYSAVPGLGPPGA